MINNQLTEMTTNYRSLKQKYDTLSQTNEKILNENSTLNNKLVSFQHQKSRRKSHSGVTKNDYDKQRLYEEIQHLKNEVNYFKIENNRIKHNSQNIKIEEELESVKSQNLYKEKEISQLNKQIKDLFHRYRTVIDEKNRVTVDTIVSKRNCLPNVDMENFKSEIMILKTKNKELKVKAKRFQVKDNQINDLNEEKLYLEKKVIDLEQQIIVLKNEFLIVQNEKSQNNDNMLNWWKKLYMEKNNECKIYLDKIADFQKINSNFQNVSYTKKVFQSKDILVNLKKQNN